MVCTNQAWPILDFLPALYFRACVRTFLNLIDWRAMFCRSRRAEHLRPAGAAYINITYAYAPRRGSELMTYGTEMRPRSYAGGGNNGPGLYNKIAPGQVGKNLGDGAGLVVHYRQNLATRPLLGKKGSIYGDLSALTLGEGNFCRCLLNTIWMDVWRAGTLRSTRRKPAANTHSPDGRRNLDGECRSDSEFAACLGGVIPGCSPESRPHITQT